MTVTLELAERLLAQRKLNAAARAFAAAAGDDPDRTSAGLWTTHMLDGNFEAAWRESDAIRRRGAPDRHRFWTGEDLRGKRVIVRCLHGLGDAVQFLRYAPKLRELAACLMVEVPPALLDLAPYFDGVGEVVTWGEQRPAAPPEWDVQVEVVELPYLFRTQLAELPVTTRYLRVPAPLRDVGEPLRVGVVWASGDWNPARSVPFGLLREVLDTPSCVFWNLQGGAAREQWRSLGDRANLRSDDVSATTVLELAKFTSRMDLVLTPDSLPAHVAGALGVPAWVMLERTADWRWMVDRTDSPWYPSLRLFRQQTAGDWQSVVDAVELELRERYR